ncbi:MAG TPA: DNA replication/repair protein RecF [Micavibrio sp.]|nr:DNA replication/repair protein RecF [Micavibrio sp.]HIL28467.1 DNA replication/repair protein RecF [Micavibrio sp.]
MSYLKSLTLTHFRCYEQARLEGLASAPVVLHGVNGAGKTNVLEAVSLLSPGRGMRNAKITEIQNVDMPDAAWSVAAKAETPYGEAQIGTGRDPVKDKRLVRINGEAAKGQNALAEYLSCVWLTPQMDGLFLDGSSSRRRFFDRLVFTFDPAHSGRITRYENALRQRSKLLQEGHADPVWVQGLEASMAETGVAIAAARLDFVQRLQAACDVAAKDEHEAFPRSHLGLHGTLEELLLNAPALEVEDLFKYQLEQSRRLDATTGGAATGPHKTDVLTKYAAKNMPADQCSTGEQKALLIGIILAHSRLIKAERGVPPILLLDEVAAHLDDTRRHLLHDILLSLGGQVWLTGTDKALFDDLRGKAVFFEVNDSRITGQPDNKNAAKVA